MPLAKLLSTVAINAICFFVSVTTSTSTTENVGAFVTSTPWEFTSDVTGVSDTSTPWDFTSDVTGAGDSSTPWSVTSEVTGIKDSSTTAWVGSDLTTSSWTSGTVTRPGETTTEVMEITSAVTTAVVTATSDDTTTPSNLPTDRTETTPEQINVATTEMSEPAYMSSKIPTESSPVVMESLSAKTISSKASQTSLTKTTDSIKSTVIKANTNKPLVSTIIDKRSSPEYFSSTPSDTFLTSNGQEATTAEASESPYVTEPSHSTQKSIKTTMSPSKDLIKFPLSSLNKVSASPSSKPILPSEKLSSTTVKVNSFSSTAPKYKATAISETFESTDIDTGSSTVTSSSKSAIKPTEKLSSPETYITGENSEAASKVPTDKKTLPDPLPTYISKILSTIRHDSEISVVTSTAISTKGMGSPNESKDKVRTSSDTNIEDSTTKPSQKNLSVSPEKAAFKSTRSEKLQSTVSESTKAPAIQSPYTKIKTETSIMLTALSSQQVTIATTKMFVLDLTQSSPKSVPASPLRLSTAPASMTLRDANNGTSSLSEKMTTSQATTKSTSAMKSSSVSVFVTFKEFVLYSLVLVMWLWKLIYS